MDQSALPSFVAHERHGPVAVLTLDSPANRNALSRPMMDAMQGHLSLLAAARDVHAVVLAARGPAFSAGHDLRELTARRSDADGGAAFFAATMAQCSALMQQIVALPQPVVAAIEGVATAAGCQLVATCDLAVAGAKARFCTPGVHIGLFCSTPMVALTRNLARKHAMEMLLTGDMISADDAARMGLLNRVVAAGAALPQALALAQAIASKSARTVRLGKAAFYAQADLPLAQAYEHAARVMTQNMLDADAAEGIGAFLDKRTPRWSDA